MNYKKRTYSVHQSINQPFGINFKKLKQPLVGLIFLILNLIFPNLIFSQSSAQTTTTNLTSQQELEIENTLGFSPLSVKAFDINKQTINSIVKSQNQSILLNLIIGSHSWNIQMGEAPIFVNNPVCNIYKGVLTNTSSYSNVYLHISADYFYGTIQEGDKKFRITSLPESLTASITEEFLLYEIQKIPPTPPQSPNDCSITVELGVEVDWKLYNKINQNLGGGCQL